MKGKLFLCLFLFSVICKGQLYFDYKKDTIETFNVTFIKKRGNIISIEKIVLM